MATNFNIAITATDRATAVFRKVNREANKLTQPFAQAGKSFKSLGREMGFQRIGKDLQEIGRQAYTASRGVASVVAPMAALTGVGTVAGMAALADSWARLGRQTVNAAGNIGVSTQALQRFQGMARLSGISTDEATSSLQGLAATMQNAQWGRDNEALMMFNRLTGGIKRSANGAIDAQGEFMALAQAIGKIKDPQAQMVAASKFHMQAFLPLIRQGPAAMAQLQARAQAMGLVMSGPALKAATDFANSLDNLQGAGIGLKNSIMEQVTPAFKPLIDGLAGWIVQNRELIAQDVGDWAKGFADWMKSIDWKGVGDDIKGFAHGVKTVVNALGGWKHVAELVGIVMGAKLIGSVLALGATLIRGGVGIYSFIRLLMKWRSAATLAKVATEGAADAAEAVAGAEATAGAAGGAEAAAAGMGLMGGAGIVVAAGALKGDVSDSSRNAQQLENAAMAGDQGAARQLARTQLTHWWNSAPSEKEINDRAAEISSGRQAGISPEQMARLHPQHADAEKRLAGLEKQYNLPSGLLDSVWRQESGRGANMVSPAGAQGHFQFMPATAQQYGLKNPNDFNESSDAAARMYRDLLKQNGGNLDKALAGYNWGQGNVEKKGMDAAPAETRKYVQQVEAGMEANQNGAGQQVAQAPAGPYTSGKPEAVNHSIDVTFNGLPSGATTDVKSSLGANVKTKIGFTGLGSIA